ncbi:hypothetical protein [Algoriphagus persicinus]|uniref:hypothetical protein n=1 Tax=Algoriphagus persicinus TaxID=3108754 RepID=UPI002B3AC3DC|nr:hypothetical protein [Algoriphagus sp. E1-3-M2]MEB2785449.1 hypothetical protein [Algoriphagus sp. E1-3-M2]
MGSTGCATRDKGYCVQYAHPKGWNIPFHLKESPVSANLSVNMMGLVKPSEDPMGRKLFWFTVVPLEPAEEGTDRYAVENNLASLTP